VIHRKSEQFSFSLHVKIKHIEFEDKFSIKTHETVNIFVRRLLTNREIKELCTTFCESL